MNTKYIKEDKIKKKTINFLEKKMEKSIYKILKENSKSPEGHLILSA